MYQINKPLRVVKQESGKVLINIPRVELYVEVNQNVVDFLEFLENEAEISKDSVNTFIQNSNITNVEDYEDLFEKLIDYEVLIMI